MLINLAKLGIFRPVLDDLALAGEDIAVTVDLGDYSAASGTYTVPAQVSVRKGDIGVSGTYQIQVTIREGGEEPPQEDGTPEEDGPEAEG